MSTLWQAIDRLQLTVKKTVYAAEQRRPDVVAAERQWQTWLPLRDVRQYVFLDECGVTTDLLRRYGAVRAANGSAITRPAATGRRRRSSPRCGSRA